MAQFIEACGGFEVGAAAVVVFRRLTSFDDFVGLFPFPPSNNSVSKRIVAVGLATAEVERCRFRSGGRFFFVRRDAPCDVGGCELAMMKWMVVCSTVLLCWAISSEIGAKFILCK